MTPEDREQLLELNRNAAPLPISYKTSSLPWVSSTSVFSLIFSFEPLHLCRWKHEPTPIKPSSSVSGMSPKRLVSDFRHRQAPVSRMAGHNPYGHNPNRKVGNLTSARVLGRSNDPPPRKKVKTEHPHAHTATGGLYTQHGDRNNTRK